MSEASRSDLRDARFPTPVSPSQCRREELLEAALGVAVQSGFGRITMDAVAQRAGISKGGLLYHFHSKARLIEALLARYCVVGADGDEKLSGITHGIGAAAVSLLIAASDDPAILDRFIKGGRQAPNAEKRWALFSNCLQTHLRSSRSRP